MGLYTSELLIKTWQILSSAGWAFTHQSSTKMLIFNLHFKNIQKGACNARMLIRRFHRRVQADVQVWNSSCMMSDIYHKIYCKNNDDFSAICENEVISEKTKETSLRETSLICGVRIEYISSFPRRSKQIFMKGKVVHPFQTGNTQEYIFCLS